MNTSLRKLVRELIKESYSQELLDMILDKVSQYGIESLTKHEKEILDNISTQKKEYKNDLDLIFDFLTSKLGVLKGESYSFDKLAKKVDGIRYFDKHNDLAFDLEVSAEVLGIKKPYNTLYADQAIFELIHENFTISDEDAEKAIKLWFEKETDNKVSKVSFMFFGK